MKAVFILIPKKQRLDFIDMAKGYGILFIMIGHLGVFKLPQLLHFHVWIYSFHIPLFFFLSGFLFKADVTVKQFVTSKLKSIVIPYFCTGVLIILYELYHASCMNTLTWKFVGEQFKLLVIQRRTWTIWFLAALLVVNIIAFVLKKLLKKDLFVAVAVVVMAVLGLIYYSKGGDKLPWDIDVALPALPFFFGGYLLRQHFGWFKERFGKKRNALILFAVSLAISIVTALINYKSTHVITDMFGMKYGFAPLMYFSAFAGITAVLAFSSLFTVQPFRYIGANSLTYFAFHQTIVLPLTYTALNVAHITISNESLWWEMVLYWLLILFILIARLTVWNFFLVNTRLSFIVGKWRKKEPNPQKPAKSSESVEPVSDSTS